MENHLLEYIEIKDFKCFKNFKAEGFKRVNLIGGKNNVGKTAFMEACYINTHSHDIRYLTFALENINFARNNLEYVAKGYSRQQRIVNLESNNINVISNKNSVQFNVIDELGIKNYKFIINELTETININNFSYSSLWDKSIIHIDNFGLTNSNLKDIFESVQKKDKEEILYRFINEFDNNIDKFKIMRGENPECKVIDRDEYQDINEFGDGLKHYISIICSLYACENGYLFIDEIDNGIHYTQLDRLWEIILTISKEQNVQVFATTHSKECIESYARVSKKFEDEDISFIELGKNKENKLDSIVMNSERLQRHLSQGNEVRGW